MTADSRAPGTDLSVIVPVTEFHDDLLDIHDEFRAECERLGRTYEFIFVVHGDRRVSESDLETLEGREHTIVIRLAFTYDESAALNAGFRTALGRRIVTIPAYHSVDPVALESLLQAADEGADCAVAVRSRRRDPLFNRIQARLYNACVSAVAGHRLRDISNAARVLRVDVARGLHLYGDQYRYLPVLLAARGYRVVEVEVRQSPKERRLRVFGPATYVRRLVDLLGIFFLVRFTSRPLRFFGILGGALAAVGLAICLVLTYQRLIMQQGLADRPALLLGVLLLVLGVQTATLGLLGELVVHLQSQRGREIEAEEIAEADPDGDDPGSGGDGSQAA
jgi:hypothetical protein